MRFVFLEIEYLIDAFYIDQERHNVADLRYIILRQSFGIVLLDKVPQTLMANLSFQICPGLSHACHLRFLPCPHI